MLLQDPPSPSSLDTTAQDGTPLSSTPIISSLEPRQRSRLEVVDMVSKLSRLHNATMDTKCYALNTYAKLSVRYGQDAEAVARIGEFMEPYSSSMHLELQQRAMEYQELLKERNLQLRSEMLERMPRVEEATLQARRKLLMESVMGGNSGNDGLTGWRLQMGEEEGEMDLMGSSKEKEGDIERGFTLNTTSSATLSGNNNNNNQPDLLLDLDDIFGGGDSSSSSLGGGDLLMSGGLGLGPTTTTTTLPPSTSDPVDVLLTDLFSSPSSSSSSSSSSSNSKVQEEDIDALLNLASSSSSSSPPSSSSSPQNTTTTNPSFVAFQSRGVFLHFTLSHDSRDLPNTTTIHCRSTNNNSEPATNFVFQAAVPKYLQLQMSSPSGTEVPPRESGSVTQEIKVTNMQHGSKKLMMKLKVSFDLGSEHVEEMTQISDFPDLD
jgi:AP-1 complex subunit gamma-1